MSILNGVTPGKRLKRWRTDAGLTQRELAERLGRGASYVAHWENDDWRPNPDERRALETITSGAVAVVDWLKPDERRRLVILENVEPYEADPDGGEAA